VKPFIAWQDEFSVGVADIDGQHKKLLQVINVFLSSLADDHDREAIDLSLTELIQYTEYHFYSEQLLLERHPDFPGHLNQHWQLIKRTKKIQDDYRQNPNLTADVFDFLLSWLKEHILGTDKAHFDYLRKNNLLPEGTN
jgi:hemerythrin-like metal-binding protein